MNNEQQQIIDEVYEAFVAAIKINRPDDYTRPIMTRAEFVKELRLNPEYSEKWELKIGERELSLEERLKIADKFNPLIREDCLT